MRPIEQYVTIRKGQVELRRQAEHEQMIGVARLKQWMHAKILRKIAGWLGTRLVTEGRKREWCRALSQTYSSPHH